MHGFMSMKAVTGLTSMALNDKKDLYNLNRMPSVQSIPVFNALNPASC